jgi:hypothetical protein
MAGSKMGREIRNGRRDKLYNRTFKALPEKLREEIKGLVYDQSAAEYKYEKEHVHPFAAAIGLGLVVGLAFADEVLRSNVEFDKFTNRIKSSFKALRAFIANGKNAAELRGIILINGSEFANFLEEAVDPDSIRFDKRDDSHIELQRAELYACFIGYVGVAATIRLAEKEIRRSQPRDWDAVVQMDKDIDILQDQEFRRYYRLTVSDFGMD